MANPTFSKLITSLNPKKMNASSRNGIKIDRIVIHHNAMTDADKAMNIWIAGGPANTSAHYEVTPTEIIGCVGEQYAAWHAGGIGQADPPKMANPNQRSIGIENVNSTGAPEWLVDPRTVQNCARLVADICTRYQIPLDRQHILAHREVTNTACPGGLDVDEVVRLARIGFKNKKADNHE
ncbi:N-acetylmuramoyl-L-alanine amidase [Lentilactobacillus parafarraginis F0439]|uniref:N-acetylmuramoyl-L-alanine amidase n=1 Tax=Lentilactobacillus parafarraginis F0439 TaxID=797515 RepID=G9ZSW7_9LACO|nr:peptidoglycan recognition family protein [Lentilactobacillus parafarraginis]EHL95684.1 N-acetylmuramoyl-L-alanine amidase [Lentilactobacillus parafarraginis F0439]